MSLKMKHHLKDKSANFLLNASLLYRETCPEQSRFFLRSQGARDCEAPAGLSPCCVQLRNGTLPICAGEGQWPVKSVSQPKRISTSLRQNTLVCPHCHQWRQPGNHRTRLRPKRRPSARVQSVLRRKARGKRLSLAQKHLLHRFQNSSSALMATCHTCNTTSRHKGMNRDFITTLAKTHSTPGSAGKHKTPQSTNRASMATPKTPGKDKTPVHTPRSSVSSNTSGSGASSSKPPSKPKNWVVQRLSKILTRDETQGSKKRGLKDFLSSL